MTIVYLHGLYEIWLTLWRGTISGKYLPQIKKLLTQFGVERAYLFGSAAKGNMNENSDVDFIIKFPDDMHYVTYSDNYFALADALEVLLK